MRPNRVIDATACRFTHQLKLEAALGRLLTERGKGHVITLSTIVYRATHGVGPETAIQV